MALALAAERPADGRGTRAPAVRRLLETRVAIGVLLGAVGRYLRGLVRRGGRRTDGRAVDRQADGRGRERVDRGVLPVVRAAAEQVLAVAGARRPARHSD